MESNFHGVLVLYNESRQLRIGEPQDMLAETQVVNCSQAVANALVGKMPIVSVPIVTDLETALLPYPADEWVVFNLGEGFEGRLFEEARIAYALEAMGYAFTGNHGDALAQTTNKEIAKTKMEEHGILTPPWWLYTRSEQADCVFPFPLIVKPIAEDGSIGIGEGAVIHSLPELRERIAYVVRTYRQKALVEKFIIGREINVSLWGDPPEVLPCSEIDFHDFSDVCDRFVSFEAKWEVESFEYNHTPGICPARLTPALEAQILETVLKVWRVFNCRGYARVDFRIDDKEIPYVVDVNCNPDLSPGGGFSLSAGVAGYSYPQMISKVLEMGMTPSTRFR